MTPLGLLDLPAPLLDLIDQGLAWLGLPALLRVLLAGSVAGAAGAWIYRRCSPQARIADLRRELAAVQAQLRGYDGAFAGLLDLIRRQFALNLRQLRLTAVAALLAGLPALLVLPWLSNRYEATFPDASTPVRICAEPAAAAIASSAPALQAGADGCLQLPWPPADHPIPLHAAGHALVALPPARPATVIHPYRWFNLLVGNPAGYLPDGTAVNLLRLDLPRQDLLGIGPGWLRGWPAPFFAAALAVSLLLHRRWRLH
ncbi:hypothetical protein [Dokdonella koreensis]|uniref:Transmembrane protein n=1 Tax=Dokdonella koreensis DS-123 TaxID=1300342 RepID=A0A160DW05_9GAMM|nr:hypothetical protein [Dokdonella koreensis]ANB18361.1 Hypothetical protein I596_2353 [Dokdonella koreensis DS-123]